jgi:hypothetical protein
MVDMKYKTSEWQELKTDAEKSLVIGKLEGYKDCVDYLNSMRESLTRLLLVNDVKEEDYEKLKTRWEGKKVKIIDSGEYEPSFDNC